MSVFMLCEQAVGLVRGKRLILSGDERAMLEALNYEGLTAAHAQDEAVVCALHFERIRDRLLQIYPWVFARKKANVSGGGLLPDDCLTVLCVIADDMPVDYEITEGKLNTSANAEVHYTGKITDINKWSGIFRDVFVYSLAIEICSAVTGKPEYTQLLEQKVQELIHRAHQTGAIQSETRITLNQEIFNRAIGLSRGQRSVKPTSEAAISQGADNSGIPEWRAGAEIKACIRAYEGVRDRLLTSYPWLFARKKAVIQSGGRVPDDMLTMLAVFVDGEPQEWELVSDGLNVSQDCEIRYTGKSNNPGDWDAIFREVLIYSLASEICIATTGNLDGASILEQKSQELIRRAYQTGAIRAETRVTLRQEIFNRAIGLVRGHRTQKTTSEAATVQGTDNSGYPNDRMQAEADACLRSYESVRDRLLKSYAWKFAMTTAAPAQKTSSTAGWRYTYAVPQGCAKVWNVIANDPIKHVSCEALIGMIELADWEISGNEIYTNREAIYIRYVKKITSLNELLPEFVEVYVYLLASEVALNVTDDVRAAQYFEQKAAVLIENAVTSGLIKERTGLPLHRDRRFTGYFGRPYLDYSGIPTRGGMSCENRTSELFGW